MTKNWDIFPKAEPLGEALANYSAYQVYNKFAIAGYGVLTGCVTSWTSTTRVDISSGTYTNNGAPRNLSVSYISSITAASAGEHRYDLIYIDGADDTVKRLAGTPAVPASPDDFLENYAVRPAEPTDTDWIPLAIIRVTENGLEESNFGTIVYATKSVANIRVASGFTVDDSTLQIIDGIMSIKSALGTTKLDDLAAPDNNTDLNVSISAHGLCPILSNSASQYLNGIGTFTTPTVASSAHASSHASGQSDAIKIDDLAAGDNNTDLDSTSTKHGLCPKLSGTSTQALLGNGSWGSPTPATHASTHVSGQADAIKLDDLAAPDNNTDLNVSASFHGLCPKAPAIATQFLNGLSGGWTVPNVSIYGPYRILHDGGATQAILTTSALCEIEEVVVKCQETGASRTVTLGWAADADALMTDAEVPHTLNGTKFIRNPISEITSATALIATVGGSGNGVWDIWLKIARYE
jgi:hypothetical protein